MAEWVGTAREAWVRRIISGPGDLPGERRNQYNLAPVVWHFHSMPSSAGSLGNTEQNNVSAPLRSSQGPWGGRRRVVEAKLEGRWKPGSDHRFQLTVSIAYMDSTFVSILWDETRDRM